MLQPFVNLSNEP